LDACHSAVSGRLHASNAKQINENGSVIFLGTRNATMWDGEGGLKKGELMLGWMFEWRMERERGSFKQSSLWPGIAVGLPNFFSLSVAHRVGNT